MSNVAMVCPRCKIPIHIMKFDHVAGVVTNEPCGCQTPPSAGRQASE